jgi:hypothetical protein
MEEHLTPHKNGENSQEEVVNITDNSQPGVTLQIKQKKENTFTKRPFPASPLKKALRIPKVIKEKNAGHPWSPAEIAAAIGVTPGTKEFYYLTASSRDYGLTTGTMKSTTIALAPIGNELVYTPSPQVEKEATKKAFLNVNLFNKVYEYYKGGPLPEMQYLQNILESQFGVDPKFHNQFLSVYTENIEYLATFGITFIEGKPIQPKGTLDGQRPADTKTPKATNALTLFVAIPFTEKSERYSKGFFEEVITNLITPAAEEAGFIVTTARKEGSDVIHSTIVNDLLDADLVIADLTEHNPNVLFELGLRMANNQPIAIIKSKDTLPIFDVDNMLRVLEYDPNLWVSTLKTDVPKLAKHIKGAWDDRDKGPTYMAILRRKI